jgi:hypothetical protein
VRVPRPADEPGKGAFWAIDTESSREASKVRLVELLACSFLILSSNDGFFFHIVVCRTAGLTGRLPHPSAPQAHPTGQVKASAVGVPPLPLLPPASALV